MELSRERCPGPCYQSFRHRRWKHLTAEAFEDYLRVALIRPGDSVIINEAASCIRTASQANFQIAGMFPYSV